MSEHRRRSPNPGGGEQPPGRRADGGRPYAYGTPPEGAPSYDRPGPPRPPGGRETARQPRLTRAEMRKQAQKGGKRGAAEPAAGRGGKPGKKRFIDYPRYGKSGVRRWLPSWKQLLTVFLIFFGGGVATVGVAYSLTPVPDVKDLVHDQNNIYYWADGQEMTRQGTTNRQVVKLGDISKPAQNAVVAAENESFWNDTGIDPKGIARAVYNMATGGETQGGSTITQQYVKNAYLSQDQTLSRKAKEFFITLKINQSKGKEDILEGYLNTSWFGRGATGIQAAAQAYYGVDSSKIDACQGAMLAGLLKGAGLYDPTISPANHARMEDRWKWILDRMVITKMLSPEERAKCTKFPEPVPKKAPASMNGEVSYLVDMANNFLMAKDKTINQAVLDKGGFQIYTTFQRDKVDALKKAVDDFQAATLHPDRREQDKFVQVGAASVLPNDGAIVAIYGGPGVENKHYTNNADAGGIPVGSTFKPFVLATAMQNGVLSQTGDDGKPKRINAESRYLADNMAPIYKADGSPAIGDDGKPYHQRNSGGGAKGFVTLKTAMQYSYNVPFVQLGQDVGGQNVEKMVKALGLTKGLVPSSTLTYPLGTSTPSAIRMASAYSVFAARGQQTDPYSVWKVVKDGIEKPGFAKPKSKAVLDQAVADNITDVLENVAKNGTGKAATSSLGFPVAGKTGTTDAGTSAWWVGYTTKLVTSVGMWREEPGKPGLLSLDGTAGKDEIHGGDFPADIFARYMRTVMNGQKGEPFPDPEPIGEQVDSSGAPSTASPSASASESPSTAPTTALPSATTSASKSTDPTTSPTASPSCFLGFCPTSTKKPTGKPDQSPSDTSSPSAGAAANNTSSG